MPNGYSTILLHNAHPWHDYDIDDDEVDEDEKTVRRLTLIRGRKPTNAVLYQTVVGKLEKMSRREFKDTVLKKRSKK